MDIALDLLKAPHVGIREFKERASFLLNKRKTLVVTDRGKPTSVLVSYGDMLELLDVIEEINDPKTLSLVEQGRKSIKQGSKGIPVLPNA